MVGIEDRSGQTSVEAALLVPVVLTLVALLVQPACVLYTRAVMASTAAELTRDVVPPSPTCPSFTREGRVRGRCRSRVPATRGE